ncbi:MAG: hypothetical protein LiPW15_793 [Parcubacteria group bacterium LiPW_15]|nr:MAG: hypothetical protein LiPW15_793 [Parcubacteria group bacterium LiPW_15]
MLNISSEQARARLKTLPEEIKSAIFSVQSAEIIGKIGEESHLTQEKTSEVARVAGLVLLGFLHAEDTAKELEQGLAINSLMARSLQDSLQKKLFSPYRDVLEKIYSPKPEEAAEPQRISLDSITPAKAVPSAGGINAPKPLDTISAPPAAAPAAPKPAPSPTLPPVAPAPAAKVNPFASFGGAATPAPTPAKAAEPSKPVPAPFVMHTENKEPQIVQAPKFKLETSGAQLSAFGSTGKVSTVPQAPKPAQVEIGREEKLKPRETVGKFESAPKAIHYSSLSSPITAGGEPTNTISPKPVSFGNISPMPASSAGKPASPVGGPALPTSTPVVPAPPSPGKSVPSQAPTTPKLTISAKIPANNTPVRESAAPDSFGRLVKNMISPEEKASPSRPPSRPAA